MVLTDTLIGVVVAIIQKIHHSGDLGGLNVQLGCNLFGVSHALDSIM